MMAANLLAIYVITAWAFWCLLSRRVSDGIIGKVLYLLLILAALGWLSHQSATAQEAINITFAAIGVRHFWLKTIWPHISGACRRRLRCSVCPHKD